MAKPILFPRFELTSHCLEALKEDVFESQFGLDNSTTLIDGGFGLYSSARSKKKIEPHRSYFYRIGFCRKGTVEVTCGPETFRCERNTIHFNFPGQMFSLDKRSPDMFAYYLLFTTEFIEELLPVGRLQVEYRSLHHTGDPCFKLSEPEAEEIEQLFIKIDKEIKNAGSRSGRAIRLYLELILIGLDQSYERQKLNTTWQDKRPATLAARFVKLVAQHFLTTHSIGKYAKMLSISAKYLGRTVKEETGKAPSDFINETLTMEIKRLLRYTELRISEIAHQLKFNDPSHLARFFKKHSGRTPKQFRKEVAEG